LNFEGEGFRELSLYFSIYLIRYFKKLKEQYDT